MRRGMIESIKGSQAGIHALVGQCGHGLLAGCFLLLLQAGPEVHVNCALRAVGVPARHVGLLQAHTQHV